MLLRGPLRPFNRIKIFQMQLVGVTFWKIYSIWSPMLHEEIPNNWHLNNVRMYSLDESTHKLWMKPSFSPRLIAEWKMFWRYGGYPVGTSPQNLALICVTVSKKKCLMDEHPTDGWMTDACTMTLAQSRSNNVNSRESRSNASAIYMKLYM